MGSNEEISVNKRNGRGKESLQIDKIHAMVGFATDGITGVSASHVEMNRIKDLYDTNYYENRNEKIFINLT